MGYLAAGIGVTVAGVWGDVGLVEVAESKGEAGAEDEAELGSGQASIVGRVDTIGALLASVDGNG